MDAPISVAVALIYPGERARRIDKDKVSSLAKSMSEIGLRTPISICPATLVKGGREIDAYNIIAGHHRYEAALKLHWEEIAVFILKDSDDINNEIWAIDENLMRVELSPAQEVELTTRRKQLWEAKNSGADCATIRGPGMPSGFASETAERVGKSKSTINRALARGEKIASDVIRSVQGTKLDTGAALDKLAKLSPAKQRRAVNDEKLPSDQVDDLTAIQKQVLHLMAAWNRAGAEARREFLVKIDYPVFDNTRAGNAA